MIFSKTGTSREDRKPVAFSAFTARSSPKIPAVCLVANLDVTAMSSINAAISSKIAKKPEAILYFFIWNKNRNFIDNSSICDFENHPFFHFYFFISQKNLIFAEQNLYP